MSPVSAGLLRLLAMESQFPEQHGMLRLPKPAGSCREALWKRRFDPQTCGLGAGIARCTDGPVRPGRGDFAMRINADTLVMQAS